MQYNIVIPFDFSDQSRLALKIAADISENVDATLHLIHVLPAAATAEDVKNAETELREAAEKYNCKIEFAVRTGPIGGQLLDYSSKLVNPVMLISRGEKDKRPAYTGPNALFLIANATFPVMLLKSDLDFKKINTVLVPLDVEMDNKLKLSYAMFLSRFFSNALIRLVSVVYEVDDFKLHQLMQRLNRLTAFFDKSGINSVGEIIRVTSDEGESYSKVAVDYAEKSEAELVLIITNEEKFGPGCGISQDADYMLTHFRNNILSVTPFIK